MAAAGIVNRVGPYIIPTAGIPGAIVINSAWLSHTTITFNDLTTLKVLTDLNPTWCHMIVNNNNIPLYLVETGATEIRWERSFAGSLGGVGAGSTVHIYAGNNTDLGYDNSLALTIIASANLRPMYYVQSLLKSNWIAANVPEPAIVPITDEKRINLANRDKIIIRQKPRERKIRGRGQYKDTKYPISLDIHTTKSDVRKDALLTEVIRIMQLFPRFLPSNEDYDYIDWTTDGEDASMAMAKKWKMIYDIKLVKILRKID